MIIARGKTLLARLVPYGREQPKRGFVSMKGRARLDESFWEPLPEKELKLWEDGLASVAVARYAYADLVAGG